MKRNEDRTYNNYATKIRELIGKTTFVDLSLKAGTHPEAVSRLVRGAEIPSREVVRSILSVITTSKRVIKDIESSIDIQRNAPLLKRRLPTIRLRILRRIHYGKILEAINSKEISSPNLSNLLEGRYPVSKKMRDVMLRISGIDINKKDKEQLDRISELLKTQKPTDILLAAGIIEDRAMLRAKGIPLEYIKSLPLD